MKLLLFFLICLTIAGQPCCASDSLTIDWISINGATVTPFLNDKAEIPSEKKEIKVNTFSITKYAISNLEFLKFVEAHPEWRREKALKLFVDNSYLQHWQTVDFKKLAEAPMLDTPVVNVSWFAARNFCKWIGGRLPTTLEWELAADTENKENLATIMDWYAKTSSIKIANRSQMKKNSKGPMGIHGVIWEWVEDYNSVMIATDSRNQADSRAGGLFCGGGSLNAKDSANYGAFMRYAFRSALDGKYTNGLLGFRCAKD